MHLLYVNENKEWTEPHVGPEALRCPRVPKHAVARSSVRKKPLCLHVHPRVSMRALEEHRRKEAAETEGPGDRT